MWLLCGSLFFHRLLPSHKYSRANAVPSSTGDINCPVTKFLTAIYSLATQKDSILYLKCACVCLCVILQLHGSEVVLSWVWLRRCIILKWA